VATVTIGADIGQRVDPTAIAVAEVEWRPAAGGRRAAHFLIRHLERLPLGTPYPAIAARLAGICSAVKERTRARPVLYLDATGVGTPVVDALEAARVRARIVAVFFTFGDKRTETVGEVRLGKGWLVSRLQVLLQSDRLHLPDTGEARALAEELLDYEIRIDPDGDAKFGAFKVGLHDDLVTALGLATQLDRIATDGAGWVITGVAKGGWRSVKGRN
jgi:hypothetical protein